MATEIPGLTDLQMTQSFLARFDSIHVGMESIRPKLLKTYTANTSFIVKHFYNRIFKLADYVFVFGQYKVGQGDSTKGGRFEGNMSNLLKRSKNGNLLMHTQALSTFKKWLPLSRAIKK